jgi:hypothetical protein
VRRDSLVAATVAFLYDTRRPADNKSIMITKESKKIIRTYNKVARALIEYETLWHHAV